MTAAYVNLELHGKHVEAESPARRWCMFFSSSRGSRGSRGSSNSPAHSSSLQQPHIINHDLALAHTRVHTRKALAHTRMLCQRPRLLLVEEDSKRSKVQLGQDNNAHSTHTAHTVHTSGYEKQKKMEDNAEPSSFNS